MKFKLVKEYQDGRIYYFKVYEDDTYSTLRNGKWEDEDDTNSFSWWRKKGEYEYRQEILDDESEIFLEMV